MIRTDRIGEKRMMNCGMEAEIVKYRGVNDIDIRFADDTVIANKTYYNFLNGKIRNPNIKISNSCIFS